MSLSSFKGYFEGFSSGGPIVKRLVFRRNFSFQMWLGFTAARNGFQVNVVKPKQKSQITMTNHNRCMVWVPIGWETGVNFSNQSQGAVKQNQSEPEVSLEAQMKTILNH